MKLKILDLFSGLGGFSLGLERTGKYKTVAFCEIDKYCTLLLQKHWKGVKIYNDVKKITKEGFEADGIESPDIITGGFPCQPFSVAGKQKGTSDDRHLWPEMFRIIKAFKPRFVIGENVPGIVNIQDGVVFETVCTDLESQGYEVQPFNIPAAAVGAPHQRKRIWIIAIREDVVNAKHNGSLTSTIEGSFDKTSNNNEKRQNETSKFERTSRSRNSEDVANANNARDRASKYETNENRQKINEGRQRQSQLKSSGYSENVENSNDNGLEGRLSETRNQVSSRQESTINGIENTNLSSRRSDGGADQTEPRIDGEVQGLRNGNEEESSRTTGVRGLHEGTNDSSSSIREDRNQEDDNRTLVQKRQGGVQSSISGGLGTDQTSLEDNRIRQGDDNTTLNRMERRHENVENSRRTLRQGSELFDTNEDEVGKENANQYQRSSSPSESNVANTESISSDVGEHRKHQTERNGQSETRGESSEELANTNSERLEGLRQSSSQFNETSSSTSRSEERQGQVDQGWWSVEPNVGRVAHGVSGRVHRLKGLGNSIVPQIAEEIGKAIIKAAERK